MSTCAPARRLLSLKPTCTCLSEMGKAPVIWSSVCLKLPQGQHPTGPATSLSWGHHYQVWLAKTMTASCPSFTFMVCPVVS